MQMSMPKGYGSTFDGDPRMKTEDRALITDGGRYFNYYDGYWITVHFGNSDGHHHPTSEYWDGWFSTKKEDGTDGAILNGERMASRMPAWMEK